MCSQFTYCYSTHWLSRGLTLNKDGVMVRIIVPFYVGLDIAICLHCIDLCLLYSYKNILWRRTYARSHICPNGILYKQYFEIIADLKKKTCSTICCTYGNGEITNAISTTSFSVVCEIYWIFIMCENEINIRNIVWCNTIHKLSFFLSIQSAALCVCAIVDRSSARYLFQGIFFN